MGRHWLSLNPMEKFGSMKVRHSRPYSRRKEEETSPTRYDMK